MYIGPCIIMIVEEWETNLMSQFIKFYFTSSTLNMFRVLIHPSPGACDFSIVSPHWLCVLVSMCVWVSVWLGWGGIRVAGWSLPPTWYTIFCCIISLLYASTCFEHYMFIISRSKLYYTVSGIITFCRWPSRAQVEDSSLNLCTGRPPTGVMIPDTV